MPSTWAVDSHLVYPFLGHTTSVAWLKAIEKELKEAVTDHFHFFLILFLSMVTQCQNEKSSSFVCHFYFLCEQGAMFRFS